MIMQSTGMKKLITLLKSRNPLLQKAVCTALSNMCCLRQAADLAICAQDANLKPDAVLREDRGTIKPSICLVFALHSFYDNPSQAVALGKQNNKCVRCVYTFVRLSELLFWNVDPFESEETGENDHGMREMKRIEALKRRVIYHRGFLPQVIRIANVQNGETLTEVRATLLRVLKCIGFRKYLHFLYSYLFCQKNIKFYRFCVCAA